MNAKPKPIPPTVAAGLLAGRKLARHEARKHADRHTLLALWRELSPTERRRARRAKRIRRGLSGVALAGLITAVGLALNSRKAGGA